ncbi:hypothetical protein HDU98_010145 [Podochytrium sp. JEL0797]|nr:hypothetical protein HDU98_010145 [Podochytrium sp. JEL0797]
MSKLCVPWLNGIGPYANRQETYDYFQLPFCKGDAVVAHRHESLGEALLGVNMEFPGIEIDFRGDLPLDLTPDFANAVPVDNKVVCTTNLNKDSLRDFHFAIDRHYWYKMIIDDLPVYGYIGEVDSTTTPPKRFLYAHKTFRFKYNQDRIIDVEVEAEKVPLKDESEVDSVAEGAATAVQHVEFTYSVVWEETKDSFEERYKNHITFFENKIHWFSIANSSMIVLLTMGFVVIILMRTLRKDMVRYDNVIGEDGGFLDSDLSDEYGWKQVHGDVFRPPMHLTALAGLLGSGLQLGILALIVILYAVLADVENENGHTISIAIFFYAISSILSAFYAGSYYTRNGGKNWVRLVFVSSGIWPGTVGTCVLLINFISIYQNSSRAIPFTSMLSILLIWALVVLPLSLLGVVLGKNWHGVNKDAVCRVNPIPRPIPESEWYADPVVVVAASGVLPFGAIFIEMYYIFTSFWAYRSYYVFGFMLLVFLILIIVTCCVSVVSTYFLLNSENHRWNWIIFLSGGSTAGYIFLYSIYYFYARTK